MKRDNSLSVRLPPVGDLTLAGLKVAIIGGTGGIGRAISLQMAARGAHVLVVGQTFRDESVFGIEFMKADLSLIGEAGRVAMALPAETLDLLVFTTGIMAGPQREVTADGIEQDLAISYLSRFVILKRIASRLGVNRTRSGMKPRVFVMGFPGSNQTADVGDLNSERGYGRIKAHSNTVAGNEVLVLDFARRFPGIDVFGLNPGFVKTNIRANLLGSKKLLAAIEWFFLFMALEPDIYAKRLTPLLVSPDLTGHSGAMFNNKAEAIMPSTRSTEPDYAAALMAASETVVSLVGSK